MNPVNKILLGIGAVVALVIAGVIIWLTLANAHLKTQLAQSQGEATACHMANAEFAAKAAEQNRAVAALAAESAAREKNAKDAAQTAQKTAQGFLADANRLSAKQSSGDDCKAADGLFNGYLGGVK